MSILTFWTTINLEEGALSVELQWVNETFFGFFNKLVVYGQCFPSGECSHQLDSWKVTHLPTSRKEYESNS